MPHVTCRQQNRPIFQGTIRAFQRSPHYWSKNFARRLKIQVHDNHGTSFFCHKKLTSDHPVYTDFLLGFFCLCIMVIFSDMFCNLWGKITLNGQSIASSSTHGVLATPLQVHDGVAAPEILSRKKMQRMRKVRHQRPAVVNLRRLLLLPPGWPFVGE